MTTYDGTAPALPGQTSECSRCQEQIVFAPVLGWFTTDPHGGYACPDNQDTPAVHVPEPDDADRECDDRCIDHDPTCDGYCDHFDHHNACLPPLPKTEQTVNVVEMRVALAVDGDPAQMASLFAEYVTDRAGPFSDDYSYDAWGGYDGPFVTAVHVRSLTHGIDLLSQDWPTQKPSDLD